MPELVEKDLEKLALCPPISLSNVSDPCQDVPELREGVKRLIKLLMDYGVSFFITTKGDPSFLLELPGFVGYKPKLIAVTIEGTPEILELLSPGAPSFDVRMAAVCKLSSIGINTVIRLDPVFVHVFQALYGNPWFDKIAELVDIFAASGAKHIIVSTGRLSRKRSQLADCEGTSIWQRIYQVICEQSALVAKKFEREYIYEAHWSGGGYRLGRDLRFSFHHKLRELVEAKGMIYATCQELSAEEGDSRSIPHCEGLPLPFARKQGGKFEPIPGCTANCHVSCRGASNPPCGQAKLINCKPLRFSRLCFKSNQVPLPNQ